MIKIIKDGLVGKAYFTCKECECEFVADMEDCEEDWNYSCIIWTIKCPQCRSVCKSTRGCRILRKRKEH